MDYKKEKKKAKPDKNNKKKKLNKIKVWLKRKGFLNSYVF